MILIAPKSFPDLRSPSTKQCSSLEWSALQTILSSSIRLSLESSPVGHGPSCVAYCHSEPWTNVRIDLQTCQILCACLRTAILALEATGQSWILIQMVEQKIEILRYCIVLSRHWDEITQIHPNPSKSSYSVNSVQEKSGSHWFATASEWPQECREHCPCLFIKASTGWCSPSGEDLSLMRINGQDECSKAKAVAGNLSCHLKHRYI